MTGHDSPSDPITADSTGPAPDDATSAAHPLAGRRVLVLGGTGGVGEGPVRAFLAAGAEVVVPSRSAEKARRFEELVGAPAPGRLTTLVAEAATFDEAEALAARLEREGGPIDHVVASIGGWWAGKPIWEIDEADWRRAFVDLATAHVAAIRAWLPRLTPRGSYSLVLGGSATTPVPGSGIVSMEQAALLMMRAVLGEELQGQRRVYALVLGPVMTRQRHSGRPDWITAREVGDVTVAIATSPDALGGDLQLRTHDDAAHAIAAIVETGAEGGDDAPGEGGAAPFPAG